MAQQDPINEDGVPTETYWKVAPGHSPNAVTVSAIGPRTTAAPQPLPTVPGYTIDREIGHGGMGTVYLARDSFGAIFALKTIRADRVGTIYVDRFLREKSALQELYHQNVVRIYHAGKAEDGSPYFTMPYFERGTLADHLAEFQADPRKAVALMTKVAGAIHYLHDHGQIHRDLKPQNILLSESDEPYVSDFGLVKDLELLASDEASGEYQQAPSTDDGFSKAETLPHLTVGERLTRTAGVIGTMPYMSPEQLLHRKNLIGPQSDVWALGVILYELLCGMRPFEAETPEVMSQLIRDEPPKAPHSLKVGVDPDLEKIVLRCLEKNADSRYRSARELGEALQDWSLNDGKAKVSELKLSRRKFAIGGALATGAAVTGAYFAFFRPKQAEVDSLEALRKDLREKGRVDLIGKDGLPVWSEWRTNRGHLFSANGGFVINRLRGLSLLEVMNSLAIEPFRFRVEMRQDEGERGWAGLYVGRSTHPTGDGARHAFVSAAFNDFRAGPEELKSLTVAVRSCIASGEKDILPGVLEDIKARRPADHWRTIALDMHTSKLVVHFDNQPPVEIAHPRFIQHAALIHRGRLGIEEFLPGFRPSDGIGLVAFQCAVSIRAMRIERLT